MVLIISTSLNPNSRSRILAKETQSKLNCEFLDLQEFELPMCDGNGTNDHPNVVKLREMIQAADGIVIATPVYNYTVSSSAKNLIELASKSLTKKVVGFLCAAGGGNSYMAPMSLANWLMLDFRCIILPRFVYGQWGDFQNGNVVNPVIKDRLDLFAEELSDLVNKLK